MRELGYTLKLSLLEGTIQKFLNGKSIGMYKDEADMRSHLAAGLKREGFDVDEEREVTMADKSVLRPDIIVYVQDKCIPIELKYNNTSLGEYEEDEKKCNRYLKEFIDVYDAYCIFVSNKVHRDYRPDEWAECDGNSKYHYLKIPFARKRRA